MRITNPQTGKSYVEKRRRRYAEPGQPRELTFSCYRRYPFLGKERTREWFRAALEDARASSGFHIWAYVLVPEHLHLLVYPGQVPERMPRFLQDLKEPVARHAIDYFHANPVRRGLVEKAEDWEWSSARWYLGRRPVKIERDDSVMVELARDGLLTQLSRRGEVGEVKL